MPIIQEIYTKILTFVETKEIGFVGEYQRISATEWLSLENESWEPVQQPTELENAYQLYIIQERS